MTRYLHERSEGAIETYQADLPMVAECKKCIASLIHTEDPERIALSANTSDAINIIAAGIPWTSGDRILLNTSEFPANVWPYLNLQRYGVRIDFIQSPDGRITIDRILDRLTGRTRLLALSAVQFLSGYRADLETIGEICRSRGVIFAVDGIQAVGAVGIDVQKMKIDALAAGGQKWQMAPHGTGFLYLTDELQSIIQQKALGWLAVADPWDFYNYTQPLAPGARRYEGGSLVMPSLRGYHAALFNPAGVRPGGDHAARAPSDGTSHRRIRSNRRSHRAYPGRRRRACRHRDNRPASRDQSGSDLRRVCRPGASPPRCARGSSAFRPISIVRRTNAPRRRRRRRRHFCHERPPEGALDIRPCDGGHRRDNRIGHLPHTLPRRPESHLPPAILLAWALGGIIALCGALTFAELGGMMPGAGGMYVYLSTAYSPLVGFLFGWAYFLVVNTGGIAALSITFATYLSYLFPMDEAALPATAIGGLLLLTALNIAGVRAGGYFADLFTLLKLAGIAVVILIGLGWGPHRPVLVGGGGTPEGTLTMSALAAAMIGVLWSYGGWQHVSFSAGEARHPTRSVPRAMIIGAATVTGVYLLANIAYLFLMTPAEIAASPRLAADAVGHVARPRRRRVRRSRHLPLHVRFRRHLHADRSPYLLRDGARWSVLPEHGNGPPPLRHTGHGHRRPVALGDGPHPLLADVRPSHLLCGVHRLDLLRPHRRGRVPPETEEARRTQALPHDRVPIDSPPLHRHLRVVRGGNTHR